MTYKDLESIRLVLKSNSFEPDGYIDVGAFKRLLSKYPYAFIDILT